MNKRGRPPYPDVLTPREWEVLALIRDGLTNEQIAERIGVTIHAARYHVSQILSKLGVTTREEAAAWQPRETSEPRAWVRALQFGLAVAAAGVIVSVGVLAWGVVRDSDNDAEAGAIPTNTPAQSQAATPEPVQVIEPGETPAPVTGSVRDMQLVTETLGWILTDEALTMVSLLPESCVLRNCDILIPPPQNITPDGVAVDDIRGVRFLDADHGWLVANGTSTNAEANDLTSTTQLLVYVTSDGGGTWQSSPLGDANLQYFLTRFNPAYLDFLDADNGWLVLSTQMTMNSPTGELWRTSDGGETWEQLSIPAGREVNFINEGDGWVVGGVPYDRLYATHDGGVTWDDASDIMPLAQWAGTPAFGLPTSILGGSKLVLQVTLREPLNPALFMLFESSDGGATWPDHVTTTLNLNVGRIQHSKIFDDGSAVLFHWDVGWRYEPDSSFQPFVAESVVGIAALDFVDKKRGWVISACDQGQQCPYFPNSVAQTDDGGLTWTGVETPDLASLNPTP